MFIIFAFAATISHGPLCRELLEIRAAESDWFFAVCNEWEWVFFAVVLVLYFQPAARRWRSFGAFGCLLGIPDDADQCSGDADQRFQDDGDHDSGMMPITRSGMISISSSPSSQR